MNFPHHPSKSLLLAAAGLFLAMDPSMAGDEARPQNYAEIKTELEVYANADDLMDEKLLAGREKLRSRGDEAVRALIVLFKENKDDHYRAAVVDALQHNRGDKKPAVEFLAEELKAGPEEWKGELWIAAALDFLTAASPAEGRAAAVKALGSASPYVNRAAVRSLGVVGKAEDVPKLRALALKKGQDDPVAAAATAVSTEIGARTAPKK